MGDIAAVDWRLMGTVWFGLFMFGLAFNTLVTTLGDLKQGYTALLVVAGVAVTLIGLALIDAWAALLALVLFTASGTPMIIGDIIRTVRAREQALRRQREAAELIERRMNDGKT